MIKAKQAKEYFQHYAKEFVNIPDFSMGVDIIEWKVRIYNLWVKEGRDRCTGLSCKNLALAFMNPKIGRVQQTTCVSFSKGWEDAISFLVKKKFVEVGLDRVANIPFEYQGMYFNLDPVSDIEFALGRFEPFKLDETFEIQK